MFTVLVAVAGILGECNFKELRELGGLSFPLRTADNVPLLVVEIIETFMCQVSGKGELCISMYMLRKLLWFSDLVSFNKVFRLPQNIHDE